MKLALAQINPTVGDFDANRDRIRNAAVKARDAGADLVVFPELAVCGYMPRDLLAEPSFIDACARVVRELAADSALPPLLVGAPARAGGPGKPLENVAWLMRGGTAEAIAKQLLPTYDVFDERRYFRPGPHPPLVTIGGALLGVTICEDMWAGAWSRGEYNSDPVAELVARGAQVLVNLSASPYAQGKPELRRSILAGHTKRHGVPMALCNLVGANDQLVFDGNSCAFDASGALCAHGAAFTEDLLLTDFTGRAEPPADDVKDALVLGIRDYFAKTGFEDAIVGLSGGVDSALTVCLAAEALGADHVTGIAMPGPFSAPMSLEDARELAQRLGIGFHVVPITAQYESARAALQEVWGERPFDVAEENLQARLRGVVLMALANKNHALVLTTSNKSEFAVGYSTLYGDMVGALAPLTDLYKGQVYELA
ncbi:MAG: NAD(+) synthase, partial [Planctomycetota bacterium]|nr:NAD(+) synthase [Planctomycetota bacterium]